MHNGHNKITADSVRKLYLTSVGVLYNMQFMEALSLY